MLKILKKIMYITLIIIAVLAIIGFLFLQQASFGKKPSGARQERIEKSTHYKDGQFTNLSETLQGLTKEASYWEILNKMLINPDARMAPDTLPSVKNDLSVPVGTKPNIIWFGHSSYLIQIEGRNILIDPVFSERTSPVQYFGTRSYNGSRTYAIKDLPAIDEVIITHDHYDHLDYNSILELKDKAKHFYMPLGVGSHLEYWGIDTSRITELDWWESATVATGFTLTAAPARHFSGRGLSDRNKTLWASYVLKTPNYNLYLGGDSGYDTHFKEIGEKYGPFDLVFLESGQYNAYWPQIHMMPEETAQASVDLKAKLLLPVHWGKFSLALHAWDDPILRITKKAQELNMPITTPMIGERIVLDSIIPKSRWWEVTVESE